MRIVYPLLVLVLLTAGCARFWGPSVEERRAREAEAERLFEKGERLCQDGDYVRAVRILRTFRASYLHSERCDDAQYLIAFSHYQLGNYSEAISACHTLIKDFPGTPYLDDCHRILAQSNYGKGDYFSASREYLWILDNSKSEELTEKAGEEFEEVLLKKLSLRELTDLLGVYPKGEQAPLILYEMGRRRLAEGNVARAKKVFRRLVAQFPESEYSIQVRSFVGKKRAPPIVAKIGLIVPLSGEYANFGMAVRQGVELAMESGRAELLVVNSKGDPIEALKEARELIQQRKVIVILGPVVSMPTIAAAAIANSFGVPLISPTATEERIATIGPYIFQLNPSLDVQGRTLAYYAVRKMGLTRLAVLHPNDSYGWDLTKAFSQEVTKLGGSVVAAERYDEGTTDFKEQILRIKPHEADGVFIPAYPDEIVLIAPQLRYYEAEAQILGSDGWKSEKVTTLGEDYVEGVVFTSPSLEKEESLAAREFSGQFETKYGFRPTRASALGYDAARVVMEGIRGGATTPVTLREYLASVAGYWGASGLISLTGSGRSGGVSLWTIKKGEIVELR